MTYNETIRFIFEQLPMFTKLGRSAYKENLDNTLALAAFWGNPHRDLKVIHIAGTNGKGSVSHTLASLFQTAGYKTGLYTSPHLYDFRERIKVDGQMISKKGVSDFVKKSMNIIEELKPSFFELTTTMAFEWFRSQKVDIAIVEVGLGGRLDCTNIVNPLLSVITNISYDHTDILGKTLELIAREKAGIIKHKVPVVVGQSNPDTDPVFKEFALKNEAELIFADKNLSVIHSRADKSYQIFSVYKNHQPAYLDIKIDLLGNYQRKNIVTILQCIEVLDKIGYRFSKDIIYKGLRDAAKNTGLNGRWQILKNEPLIVCDTAHNPDGILQVVDQIKQQTYKNLYIVLGMVNDKDISKVLSTLPWEAHYIFTQASIPRALNATELCNKAQEFNLRGEVVPNVKEAYRLARKKAKKGDMIYIGGSTFVVAEIG